MSKKQSKPKPKSGVKKKQSVTLGKQQSRQALTSRLGENTPGSTNLPAVATAAQPPAAPRKASPGTAATAAYMQWLNEGIRLGRVAMGLPPRPQSGEDAHVLTALVRREIELPDGGAAAIEMGPFYDPSRGAYGLGITLYQVEEDDSGGLMGGGYGPGSAYGLPYPLNMVRAADAVSWILAGGLVEGRVQPDDQQGIGRYMSAAAALVTPSFVRLMPGIPPLPRDTLAQYGGYGADSDDEAVDPGITTVPTTGGVAALPNGSWLTDDPADTSGEALGYGLAEVRDYTAGLWMVEQFGLEEFVALDPTTPAGRRQVLARVHELVRQVDEELATEWTRTETQLRAEMTSPDQVAEQGERVRQLRQDLRDPTTAQAMLMVLARVLFNIEPPPPPPGSEEEAANPFAMLGAPQG